MMLKQQRNLFVLKVDMKEAGKEDGIGGRMGVKWDALDDWVREISCGVRISQRWSEEAMAVNHMGKKDSPRRTESTDKLV